MSANATSEIQLIRTYDGVAILRDTDILNAYSLFNLHPSNV